MRSFALLLLGTTAASAHAQATWRIDPKPIATIGAAETDDRQQLSKVNGALLLSDGRIIVSNGDPIEVRLYDKNGKYLRAIGSRGEGPGEYRRALRLVDAVGDSLKIVADFTSRRTLYSPSGEFVRTWLRQTGETLNLIAYATGKTGIHSLPGGVNACLRPLIAKLPVPRDTAYRELLVDYHQRVWTRLEGAARWNVYTLGGTPLATVDLPKDLEVYQIRDGVVLGKIRNTDDVEHVVAYRFAQPTTPVAAPPPCAAIPDSFPRNRSTVRVDLRNFLTASEAYFSDFARYPTYAEAQQATNFKVSDGTEMRIRQLRSGVSEVITVNPKDPGRCRTIIGTLVPDWLVGLVFCEA